MASGIDPWEILGRFFFLEILLTPSEDVEDDETLLLGEGGADESVEVESFAEHPHVIGHPEVSRQHKQYPAPDGVLQHCQKKEIYL